MRSLAGLVAVALTLGGCSASVSGEVKTGKDDDYVDFDDPVEESQVMGDSFEAQNYALLGARHDLALADGAGQSATCSCIVAVLGQASDPKFQWQGVRPRTNPETQLVVGISSQGVACSSEPEGSLGASYWGYKRSGDDIVVYVETARAGRPLTTGAVIPKPFGNGQVLVRPASRKTPYGKPLSKEAKACELGNPGRVRTTEQSAPDGVDFDRY